MNKILPSPLFLYFLFNKDDYNSISSFKKNKKQAANITYMEHMS